MTEVADDNEQWIEAVIGEAKDGQIKLLETTYTDIKDDNKDLHLAQYDKGPLNLQFTFVFIPQLPKGDW